MSIDNFYDSMVEGGHIVITCSCGITHIAEDSIHQLDEEELNQLMTKKDKHPEKYIFHDCTTIEAIDLEPIAGIVVVGCPCNRGELVYVFITDNRTRILEFYSKEIKTEFQSLDNDKKMLERC